MAKKTESLNHSLVPAHEVLPAEEVKKVVEKYRVLPNQFPKILTSDPALFKTDAKPGDLIRIKRKDVTGEYDYYRFVVKD